MEMLQLHYFRKTARLQHLSQAARELHITQPALSQMIAKLEKELGGRRRAVHRVQAGASVPRDDGRAVPGSRFCVEHRLRGG